jgi:hypothetical protein
VTSTVLTSRGETTSKDKWDAHPGQGKGEGGAEEEEEQVVMTPIYMTTMRKA